MDLLAFSPSQECRKCGSFINNKCEWRALEVDEYDITTPEHIRWECVRCGYRWDTVTKDHEEKSKGGGS